MCQVHMCIDLAIIYVKKARAGLWLNFSLILVIACAGSETPYKRIRGALLTFCALRMLSKFTHALKTTTKML